MSMRVLIFTEAGREVGYGHLSRCQVLSDAFKAKNIPTRFFVHSKEKLNVSIDAPVTYFDWETVNFSQHINEQDLCIVDSYIVSADQEFQIAALAAKVLFIDDFGNYDHPGLVLNYSLNLKEATNNNPRLLLGPKYTLLKEPFASYDSNYLIKDSVKQVLITLGGSKYSNIAYGILDVLAPKYPNILFKAIVSEKVKSYQFKNVELLDFCLPDELLKQMTNSDLVITSPSQTLYEIIKIKIPTLIIQTNINQKNNIISNNYSTKYRDSDVFINEIENIFKRLLFLESRTQLVADYPHVENNSLEIVKYFVNFI